MKQHKDGHLRQHRRTVSFGGFANNNKPILEDPLLTFCDQQTTLDDPEDDQLSSDPPRRHHFNRRAKTLDSLPHEPYDIHSVSVIRPRPKSLGNIGHLPRGDRDLEGWRRNQLTYMALSMGGPGFPYRPPEDGEAGDGQQQQQQPSDCVDKFEPLLLDYLNMGGSVDDTAAFQDFFGHHLGLQGWTLLRVAASVYANAPKCMILLLKHGADPLLKDSSGRNVYTEALATARFGFNGPIDVLHSRVPEDVRSISKLCDVTEMMIHKLRRGKLGITPQQTRQDFVDLRLIGFTVNNNSKTYHPTDINNQFAYMHLLNLRGLLSRSSLPETGDASCLQLLPEVIADQTLATKRRIIFVSHRWLSSNHPDNDQQEKFHAIVQLGLAYCNIHGTDPDDCFLWVDYCCIQQTDTNLKTLGIQALPFYIMLSDAFIAIEHEAYMTRAWCLLEYLLGCFMPIKTDGYDLYKFDSTTGMMEEMTPSQSDLCVIRPQDGGVTDPADMDYIRALTWFAEMHLYKWL